MDFEKITRDLSGFGLNLYDFALYADGKIQAHRFQPCNTCNDSYSVAKAFVVTAIGLLWDDGRLNVTDSLYELFRDDFPADMDPAWRLTTIEHAMTHRLGFDAGFLDIDTEDTNDYPSEDYLRMVLSHPLPHRPGSHYQYSDAAYYLLSRAIGRVAGENLDSLLLRRVLRPMGFREIAWSRCPREYPMGATGLYLSSVDMVKLGALYLNGGVWNDRRLLSRAWVDKVITSGYELQTITSNGLIGKGGMYGQMLMLSREKNFAVAWHAFIEDGNCDRMVDYMNDLCGN